MTRLCNNLILKSLNNNKLTLFFTGQRQVKRIKNGRKEDDKREKNGKYLYIYIYPPSQVISGSIKSCMCSM
jgi:hypothetical protein